MNAVASLLSRSSRTLGVRISADQKPLSSEDDAVGTIRMAYFNLFYTKLKLRGKEFVSLLSIKLWP